MAEYQGGRGIFQKHWQEGAQFPHGNQKAYV